MQSTVDWDALQASYAWLLEHLQTTDAALAIRSFLYQSDYCRYLLERFIAYLRSDSLAYDRLCKQFGSQGYRDLCDVLYMLGCPHVDMISTRELQDQFDESFSRIEKALRQAAIRGISKDQLNYDTFVFITRLSVGYLVRDDAYSVYDTQQLSNATHEVVSFLSNLQKREFVLVQEIADEKQQHIHALSPTDAELEAIEEEEDIAQEETSVRPPEPVHFLNGNGTGDAHTVLPEKKKLSQELRSRLMLWSLPEMERFFALPQDTRRFWALEKILPIFGDNLAVLLESIWNYSYDDDLEAYERTYNVTVHCVAEKVVLGRANALDIWNDDDDLDEELISSRLDSIVNDVVRART